MRTLGRQALLLASLVTLGLSAGGAAGAAEKVKKTNRFAASQEQEGVTVSVSWELALHSDGKFVPLIVRVANAGSGPARADLKNFTLVDAEGDTYRAASYDDVVAVHRDLGRDKRMMRQLEYGGLDTGPQRFVESSYYPYEQGVADPTTELLTMTQMIDLVYFDVPERARKQKLTLVVEGIIDAPAFRIPFAID